MRLQKLLASKYSQWQDLLRMVIVLCCMGIYVYQLYDRISYYLEEPTSFDVIVSRNESIIFPAVTFCPHKFDFESAILSGINRMMNKTFSKRLQEISFEEYGLDIDKLWKETTMNHQAFNVNIDTGEPFPIAVSDIRMRWANCLTLTPESSLTVQNRADVYFNIDNDVWHGDVNLDSRCNFQYKFHDGEENLMYNTKFDSSVLCNEKVMTELKIQQFFYKKKKTFNCINKLDAEAQRIKCINDVMNSQNFHCRHPFLNTRMDLKTCVNMTEIDTVEIQLTFIEKYIENCNKQKKSCQQSIYELTPPSKHPEFRNYSYLIVNIPSNTFQTIQEKFTYGLAALLSDVGGSLGFFLGVSVISLFEHLINLFREVISNICKDKKGLSQISPMVTTSVNLRFMQYMAAHFPRTSRTGQFLKLRAFQLKRVIQQIDFFEVPMDCVLQGLLQWVEVEESDENRQFAFLHIISTLDLGRISTNYLKKLLRQPSIKENSHIHRSLMTELLLRLASNSNKMPSSVL